MVLKESISSGFTLSNAENNINYNSIIPNGSSNYTLNYTSTDIDSDGDLIVENQPYKILVLNIAKAALNIPNSLSALSSQVILSSPVGLEEKINIEFKLHPNPSHSSGYFNK